MLNESARLGLDFGSALCDGWATPAVRRSHRSSPCSTHLERDARARRRDREIARLPAAGDAPRVLRGDCGARVSTVPGNSRPPPGAKHCF